MDQVQISSLAVLEIDSKLNVKQPDYENDKAKVSAGLVNETSIKGQRRKLNFTNGLLFSSFEIHILNFIIN